MRKRNVDPTCSPPPSIVASHAMAHGSTGKTHDPANTGNPRINGIMAHNGKSAIE